MSKKKSKKKPRVTHVTVDFGKATPIDAVSYDPTSGEVKFFHNGARILPERAVFEQAYKRKKGPKVLVRHDLAGEKTFANSGRALEGFAGIYAVDTNTKVIAGERVSVCGIVSGENVYVPRHTAIRFRPAHCMEYRGIKDNPEKVGWIEAIDAISRSSQFSIGKKLAVVVDAYLGELAAINERSQPILEEFYLPPEFTLLYASADVPNESLANQMLSLADRISSTVLNGIERDAPSFPFELAFGKAYQLRRLWTLSA